MTVGVLGGAFDPPHLGHVAVARGGIATFGLERLLVRVVEDPGHKDVDTSLDVRLALARVAFAGIPEAEVSVEPYGRTVDALEALALADPVFLIGADELAGFLEWKQPERVLELARLGVATRPGVDEAALEAVLDRLEGRHRVTIFPIEPHPIASTDLRRRLRAGLDPGNELDPAVLAEIRRLGAYEASGRGDVA